MYDDNDRETVSRYLISKDLSVMDRLSAKQFVALNLMNLKYYNLPEINPLSPTSEDIVEYNNSQNKTNQGSDVGINVSS